ncbi:MAG: TIGR03087 family PEP-CTERM/XrtA system glycosyltransferase [Candidatus Korobacteraceae bacterium]
MQILFLTHRIPYPPDKGERIRAFHELQYLGARHDVDLFCFADSYECAQNEKLLRSMCRSVHVEVLRQPNRMVRAAVDFVSGRPMSFGFFRSRTFAESVRLVLQKYRYDALFVYSSSMGQYVPQPAPAPIVVDFVDADSHKFKQYAAQSGSLRAWFYAREAHAVASVEQSLGRLAALSFAVTEHDAKELRGSNANGFDVEVIPNGVRVPDVSAVSDQTSLLELHPFVLFVGTMNYPPNSDAAVYFARTILPLVRKSHPEMKFVIVGRDPNRQVRALSAIPGVIVTGTVKDAFLYFRNAEVSVAPFRISQGFHNKIAESLAVGTPVVTTSRAKAGIGLSEREGLFVADTPEEFARKTAAAVDPGLRRRLRQNASAVRNMLSWEVRLSKMEELMLQVVSRSDRSSCELVAKH